ncbi:SH2 domain-containing protein 7 [Echeneis naucrates]|uniref:SH2 domain-containing protein 7-like n=1 Tax=Echeneis naucrates TaxID=173247 RepID=A0A665TSR2_ECHNA|nr:SH2 domain-containing protein 7-like [Echeneis naucrates]
MERKSGVDLQMEAAEGGLKELVLKWFTETQVGVIWNNGNFPDWFQGFSARKDAEEILRDKSLGCFLIRLSDKAIGYILSYKGQDRCRHFVITQNQDGQFVISGDCQTYKTLTELIEHYKVSPIQPFGEYLTSSYYEENTGQLYDVVNYNTKAASGVSVQALRKIWDQKSDHPSEPEKNQKIQQQSDASTMQPPTLPPKSKTRKLTGTVSVDAMSLSQGLPPVPKRCNALVPSLSESSPDTALHPNESQSNKSERLQGKPSPVLTDRHSINISDTSYPRDYCPPGTTYSELINVDSRRKSLPQMDNSNMEEEEYSNHITSPVFTTSASHSPNPMKRVTCHTYSLHDPRAPRASLSKSEQQSDDLEMLRSNPLYHTSTGPTGSSAHRGDGMYAEVPERPTPVGLPDDTYEQIPGEAAVQGNTYESLDDMKTKKSKSTWGKNNMKWKKFLPDYMKK